MRKKLCCENVFWMILLGTMIVPVLVGCLYATPSADDYSNSLIWIGYKGNPIRLWLKQAIYIYNTWQGTYTGLMLCGIPVYYKFGIVVFRIYLFCSATLFFYSCYYLIGTVISTVANDFIEKKRATLIFTLLLLVYVLGRNGIGEIFFWYTGVGVYTLPLAISFFAVACVIKFNCKNSKRLFAGSLLLTLLASGAALNITALFCSMILLIVIYNHLSTKKPTKLVIVGLVAFSGAIINVIAPGNWVRHDAIDSKVRCMDSFGNTILRVNSTVVDNISNGFLLILIILAFLYGYYRIDYNKVELKSPWLVTIYGYVAILLTDFPVVLGYSSAELPERVIFVEQIAIAFYVLWIFWVWGSWTRYRRIIEIDRSFVAIIFFICILSCIHVFDIKVLRELTPYKMIWHMMSGDFMKQEQRQQSIINQIETSDDANVVVTIPYHAETEWSNIKEIGVIEDSGWWVNYALSQYYGKESIRVIYTESGK